FSSVSFLFKHQGCHPGLHSFPTRRSSDLGYGSVRAVDGRDALERLQSEAFDLVLLDVMMPGIDGFGVLERMKSHPKWQHIPVIMISAMTDMASIVRCITNGAEDYLPKPFEPILLQ